MRRTKYAPLPGGHTGSGGALQAREENPTYDHELTSRIQSQNWILPPPRSKVLRLRSKVIPHDPSPLLPDPMHTAFRPRSHHFILSSQINHRGDPMLVAATSIFILFSTTGSSNASYTPLALYDSMESCRAAVKIALNSQESMGYGYGSRTVYFSCAEISGSLRLL